MQHLVNHNDLAYVLERGYTPKDWVPCPRSADHRINPQVTKFYLGDNQFLSVFHVKPVYYETVTGHWRPLSEVTVVHGNKQIVLHPDALQKMSPRFMTWLMGRQRLLGRELLFDGIGIQPRHLVYATTSPFYPDASPESTTVDGRVGYGGSTTWSTIRDAATGNDANDSASSNTAPYAGRPLGNANFYIYRYFSLFNTASIGTDDISSATYSLYVTSVNNGENDGDDYISVITTSPASNTALVVADYDQVGTTEQHDAGERKDLSSLGTGAYADWAFNATGIANINKSGISKFGAREGHDLIDSAYAGANGTFNGIGIYHAEDTNGSRDPKLVVVHAAVSSLAPPRWNIWW